MEKGRTYKDSECSFPKAGLAIMRPGQLQCFGAQWSSPVPDSLIIYSATHSFTDLFTHIHSFTPPFISSFIR